MTELIDSDEESFNPKSHKKLLEGIDRINKIQRIKKPTRNEVAGEVSEFNLIKRKFNDDGDGDNENKNIVSLHKIANLLSKNTKQIELSKKLKRIQNTNKTLKKPLEKLVADKIERKIAYENVTKRLDRWDAVVTKNRAADQLVNLLNLI